MRSLLRGKEGGRHRAMMDAGYATNLADVHEVAEAYYGAWQAKYGDQDAAGRARIWQVMSDPGLAESGYPRMVGDMNALAAELDFQPASSMDTAVRNLYVRAREVERAAPEPAPRVSDVRPAPPPGGGCTAVGQAGAGQAAAEFGQRMRYSWRGGRRSGALSRRTDRLAGSDHPAQDDGRW